MRLLTGSGTSQLGFTKDHIGDDEIPPYAILSHTWQHGEEVTYVDVINDTGKTKAGWDKIQFCAQQAKRDNLHFIWVDTCCINKAEHVELQDAINSMFRWYRNAAQCYVYLWDVSTGDEASESDWEPAFRESKWFTRGWTLQELLAPRNVKFFSREGKHLGDKRTLERQIHEITGIAISALRDRPLSEFSIKERLSWMNGRRTTRKEDKVYSLLGIFGIFLVPNYGEGEDYALKRFQRELDEVSKDHIRQKASYQANQKRVEVTRSIDTDAQGPWLVPLQRPRSFVGRETHLAQLHEHILSEDSQRLAIYGLGGCGKTALALECAYWMKEQYPMRAIFWVSAMSRERFEQAYYEIAVLLRIPNIEDDKADVKRLVKARLSDDNFDQWLIIVDNADNASVLLGDLDKGSDADRLIDYLPQSRKGSIIFTTRTRVAASKLAESKLIALGELDKAEATEIVTSRLVQEHRTQVEQSDVLDEFLSMLFFHALAIVQAVAFINTNGISLFEYIALYRNSDKDAIDLLSEEFEDQSRYCEATNAVATTWYISFEQIQVQNAIAADHLFFMACIANNEIDSSIFPNHYSKIERVKAMGVLKTYSFIVERQPCADRLRGGGRRPYTMFDIHPLVHLAIRGWLKAHHKWDLWINTALARFIKIIPYGDHSTQDYWTAYIHHAMHVTDLPELYKTEGRMTLLERIASCERSQGRYQAAERVYRQALEQRKSMSGKEHPDTLMTMGNIGLVLGHQREWTQAENMHQEVLRLTKKVSGERHPLTITAMGNLALVLLGQRKYVEAEEMYRESYLLSKEVQGMKHPDTLTSMGNLGVALTGQKKYVEAEQILRETLALRKEVQGVDHADTMSSMSALGTALRLQFKYADTETLHREELDLRKRVLGAEHPHTIVSMHNLGLALCAQKKYDETEHVQKEALTLSQKVSGKEDPSTLANMSAIAHTLHAQKKYAEAERMHRETLALKEKRLGWEHPDTLTSVYWLAALAQEQELYEDALPLYERAYTGFFKTLGKEHSTTLECKDEYDWVQRVVEEDKAAEAVRAKGSTEKPVPTGSQGPSTMEVALRPQERWREKMKKWRTK